MTNTLLLYQTCTYIFVDLPSLGVSNFKRDPHRLGNHDWNNGTLAADGTIPKSHQQLPPPPAALGINPQQTSTILPLERKFYRIWSLNLPEIVMRFREDKYKISVKARLFSNSAGRFSFSKIKTKQFDLMIIYSILWYFI